jgi:hypothetical protein
MYRPYDEYDLNEAKRQSRVVRNALIGTRAGFTSTKDQAVWCSEAERVVRIANGHPMHLFAA